MKRIFISQPMRGLTRDQIKADRDAIVESLKAEYGEGIEVIYSYFERSSEVTEPLWLLAKSIELLATADMAFFAPGWQKYRGCRIEHECAKQYDIEIIHD